MYTLMDCVEFVAEVKNWIAMKTYHRWESLWTFVFDKGKWQSRDRSCPERFNIFSWIFCCLLWFRDILFCYMFICMDCVEFIAEKKKMNRDEDYHRWESLWTYHVWETCIYDSLEIDLVLNDSISLFYQAMFGIQLLLGDILSNFGLEYCWNAFVRSLRLWLQYNKFYLNTSPMMVSTWDFGGWAIGMCSHKWRIPAHSLTITFHMRRRDCIMVHSVWLEDSGMRLLIQLRWWFLHEISEAGQLEYVRILQLIPWRGYYIREGDCIMVILFWITL